MLNYEDITKIAPMGPVIHPEPFDDDDFIYQVKWDGVRMLSNIYSDKVELINKNHNIRTDQYPELQVLIDLIKTSNVVLDGEIVVLKSGKPNFEAVISRDRASNKGTINSLQEILPVTYMVFDIVFANNVLLINKPLSERLLILRDTLQENNFIHIVESFESGINLFSAIKEQNMEGIIAKKKNSFYKKGKKHKDWLKIKYRRHQSCVVGGFTVRGNIINSLLLGLYKNNEFIYIGRVGTGLKSEEWITLTNELPKYVIKESPFNNYHQKGMPYLQPQIVVEVDYAEWTESMHLRSPVILGFVNKNPLECTI